MTVLEHSNAIMVPIEIKLDRLNELEGVVKRLREIEKDIPPGMNPQSPGLSDLPGDGGGKKPKAGLGIYGYDDTIEKTIDGYFEKIIGGSPGEATSNIAQMLKNPTGFLIRLMTNPYVISAMAVVGGAQLVHELLTMHGGIFDLHFKRLLVNEEIKGRSRQSKEAVRVGIGGSVVITRRSGSTNPAYAFNSLEAVRSGEMENIRSFQIRRGYQF